MKAILNGAFGFAAIVLLALHAAPALADAPAQTLTPVVAEGVEQTVHYNMNSQMLGSGAQGVFLFTPHIGRFVPVSAPVVIFLHGDGGLDPYSYMGWIMHLVMDDGYSVIYPEYQETGGASGPSDFAYALVGINMALANLDSNGPQPDLTRLGIVGHSAGGNLAVQLAASANVSHTTAVPSAVMVVEPGDVNVQLTAQTVQEMSPNTLLVAIEGDEDQFQSTRDGWGIFALATQIPPFEKAYFMLIGGDLGGYPLITDHYAPLSPAGAPVLQPTKALGIPNGEIGPVDTEELWPLLDSELREAFIGGRNISTVIDGAGITGQITLIPAPALALSIAGETCPAVPSLSCDIGYHEEPSTNAIGCIVSEQCVADPPYHGN